jgi:DNA-binding MarR family transcriptional regulator
MLGKRQARRTVSERVERGLLQRVSDKFGGRGVQLRLREKGKALYRKLFPCAVQSNE